MKIRLSYISNSSSSSFIIVGRRIESEIELEKLFNENKKVLVCVDNGGISGECETWVALLSKSQYKKLEKTKWYQENKDDEKVSLFDVSMKGTFRFNEVTEEYEFFDENYNNLEYHEIDKDYSSPNTNKEFNEFLKEITLTCL